MKNISSEKTKFNKRNEILAADIFMHPEKTHRRQFAIQTHKIIENVSVIAGHHGHRETIFPRCRVIVNQCITAVRVDPASGIKYHVSSIYSPGFDR